MNSRQAFAHLRNLDVDAITTKDAAAALGQTTFAASKTLSRLAESGLLKPIRQGLWWINGKPDLYKLPTFLTSPFPSYISLQTALYLHGLIEQIPQVIYVVSLTRSQRITTRLGTFSIHHIAPSLFSGFNETKGGLLLATPEKAIFDLAYLSAGPSRFFTWLPELELPRKFRKAELKRWLQSIPSKRNRTMTTAKLDALLSRGT